MLEGAKTKAKVRPFQVPISEFSLDRSPYSVRRRKAKYVSSPNIEQDGFAVNTKPPNQNHIRTVYKAASCYHAT